MPTKYQIFVSSTYEDLKTERDRVIQGILELGHIPVGMEMFSAADEAQWQIIAKHIDESDYYVVIIAHRYGSMDGETSFTRKEYEYAVSKGIPVVGFVIDPEAPWPTHMVDSDAEVRGRLSDFKSLVQSKPVGFWTNADDLYGKASVALVKAFAAQPRVGWVRTSSTLGPEVTAEISRLSSENATLRSRIHELEEQHERDSASELTELWGQLRRNEWEYSLKFHRNGEWQEAKPLPYSTMFMILAPNMVVEASTKRIDDLVLVNSRARKDEGETDESTQDRALLIPNNARNAMLADFMMLGLMEPSTKRHPVADKEEYWSLTSLGQQLLAVRKRAAFATSAADEANRASSPDNA